MKAFLKKGRFILLLLVAMAVLFNIFFHFKFPDILIYLTIMTWWGVMLGWPLEANFSFLAGIIILFLSLLSAFFYKNPFDQFVPPEKASIWFYLFFLSGVIKKIFESKENSEPTITLWVFFEKLKNLKNIKFEQRNIPHSNFNKGQDPDNFNMINIAQVLKSVGQLTKIAIFIENLTIFLFREALKEFRRFLRIVFGFSGSLAQLLFKVLPKKFIDRIKKLIIFQIVFKIPLSQSLILFLIIKNIYKEVVFFRWFYKEPFLSIFIELLFKKLLIQWLIIFVLMVLLILAK